MHDVIVVGVIVVNFAAVPIIVAQVGVFRPQQDAALEYGLPIGAAEQMKAACPQAILVVYIAGYIEATAPSLLHKYNGLANIIKIVSVYYANNLPILFTDNFFCMLRSSRDARAHKAGSLPFIKLLNNKP